MHPSHPTNTNHPPPILITPKARLTNTPVITATCLRLLHTPSSLINHTAAPTGQKNPIRFPHSISSNAPLPSSSLSSSSMPLSPLLLLLPLEEGEEEESSQRSSSLRMAVGEGIVSGVWEWAVMARNWERREAISLGWRPAERRRSKPWGSSWGGISPWGRLCC